MLSPRELSFGFNRVREVKRDDIFFPLGRSAFDDRSRTWMLDSVARGRKTKHVPRISEPWEFFAGGRPSQKYVVS